MILALLRQEKLRSEIISLLRASKWRLSTALVLLLTDRALTFVLPTASKYVIDEIVTTGTTASLVRVAWITATAAAAQAITSAAVISLTGIGAARVATDLRIRLQRHLCRLPIQFHDRNKTGSLASRVMSDIDNVKNLLGINVVETVGGVITALIAFVLIVRTSVTLTLSALLFAPCMVMVGRFGFNRMKVLFSQRGSESAEASGKLVEYFGGIRVIKGFQAENRVSSRMEETARILLGQTRKIILTHAAVSSSGRFLKTVMNAATLIVGALLLSDRAITLGDFIAFTAYLAVFMEPLLRPATSGSQISEAIASLDRVCEVLREKEEDDDPRRARVLKQVHGNVRFESVTFEYTAGNPVLRDISFEAPHGSLTAIVGRSGAGKTTLVSLVAAFAKPTAGTVYVDGTDISTVTLASYRAHLGIVTQEALLFDGTLAENLLFGRPTASSEAMLNAAIAARVDEFATRLQAGYDTMIGERGARLSGGQRQRIAIARALIAEPKILILDEATSSLDRETEYWVQQGLAALMKGRTTFVIAHRLSTVFHADQIVVLTDGRIADIGTHAELTRRCERYSSLLSGGVEVH